MTGRGRAALGQILGAALGCAVIGLVVDDALLGLSLFVLVAGLKLVWTTDGLFVLPAAFAFHWMETSIGLIYRALLNREVATFNTSNYRPMVLIGLGCCIALAAGIRFGLEMLRRCPRAEPQIPHAFSLGLLVVVYVIATVFEGSLSAMGADFPSLRQMIVTADTARLGILFLLIRRLLWPVPRWTLLSGIMAVEVALGITGFFAGFREPLVLGALGVLEIFDRRNARHWVAIGAGAAAALAIGLVWMGIRSDYRRDFIELDNFAESRSTRLYDIRSRAVDFLRGDSQSTWQTADKLVERMWTVYYPALAVERVPSQLPHTRGEILSAALLHIVTPRVFFPDKPELVSDSEKVRKYSGVFVAGVEQNTSIAFGYAAEAYVDFGVPIMFLPVLLFGVAVGCLYMIFERSLHHRELVFAFNTLAFWVSLYLFERSWATMLGTTVGMMIYLGVPIFCLDRLLLAGSIRRQQTVGPLLYSDEHPFTAA